MGGSTRSGSVTRGRRYRGVGDGPWVRFLGAFGVIGPKSQLECEKRETLAGEVVEAAKALFNTLVG